MRKTIYLLMLLIPLFCLNAQNGVIKNGDIYYLSNYLVVKFTAPPTSDAAGKISLSENLNSVFRNNGIISVEKRFSVKHPGSKEGGELEKTAVLKFTSPYNPLFLSKKISSLDEIEWAEPYFVYEEQFVPNDPDYPTLYHLNKISAADAWDVNQGNADIVIAIVDTGVDWDHPDLAANIWTNDDPVNGVDDDGNGYIDDVRGWDFGGWNGTPDNDPMEDRPDHGSLVAGLASGVTNNGIGIASIGFSCSIMPVKVTRDDRRFENGTPMVLYGFDGIVYAADNGANVVNCSWGGFSYSALGQLAVSYAASEGTVVVAAAGNNGTDKVIYPAAYDNVLSVGGTNQTDHLYPATNYGIQLDVMAPGQNIYSTWQNDTYTSASGTSLASPIVAGLAGLVTDQFPGFTPLQVAEQIRVTSDNIDALNPGYELLLGSGRVNAYSALTETSKKSVRATDFTLTDLGNGNGILEPGESVEVTVQFTNYLSPTSALTVDFSTSNINAAVTSGTFSPGAVGTLSDFDNSASKFRFDIDPSAPENTDVDFLLNYNDGTYNDFQWFRVSVNPTFATQTGNEIALTITSKGLLGFDQLDTPGKGDGFTYQEGPNLIYIGNFMYGTAANKVASALSFDGNELEDFQRLTPFTIDIPGADADVEGYTVFDDSKAGEGEHEIRTQLYSYSFSDTEFENFIILRYALFNKSGSEINGLYAGLFLDWDIDGNDYDNNTAGYDAEDNFGYSFNTDLDPVDDYVGAALISSTDYNYYALLNDASDGGIGIYDSFTDAEKWQTMSGGIQKTDAGNGDVSMTVAGGPYSIPAGGYINVAFVLAAGDDFAGLKYFIQQARIKYGTLPTEMSGGSAAAVNEFRLHQNYPNPFNPTTSIRFSFPDAGNIKLTVFNAIGEEVAELINRQMEAGQYEISFDASSLPSGIYFYRLTAGVFSEVRKMMLIK